MVLHLAQDAAVWLTHITHIGDVVRSLPIDFSLGHLLPAVQVSQTDLWGDTQRAFNNFVATGQAWAFLIGLVLGYMVKTFTSFG